MYAKHRAIHAHDASLQTHTSESQPASQPTSQSAVRYITYSRWPSRIRRKEKRKEKREKIGIDLFQKWHLFRPGTIEFEMLWIIAAIVSIQLMRAAKRTTQIVPNVQSTHLLLLLHCQWLVAAAVQLWRRRRQQSAVVRV